MKGARKSRDDVPSECISKGLRCKRLRSGRGWRGQLAVPTRLDAGAAAVGTGARPAAGPGVAPPIPRPVPRHQVVPRPPRTTRWRRFGDSSCPSARTTESRDDLIWTTTTGLTSRPPIT